MKMVVGGSCLGEFFHPLQILKNSEAREAKWVEML